MSSPGLVPRGRLGLSPTRLAARPLAPRHLPDRATRYRVGDRRDVVTESATEPAYALSEPLKLGRSGQRQVGCVTQ